MRLPYAIGCVNTIFDDSAKNTLISPIILKRGNMLLYKHYKEAYCHLRDVLPFLISHDGQDKSGRNGKRFGSNIPSSAEAFVIEIPLRVKICYAFFIIMYASG